MTATRRLYLVNQSTLVSKADARKMVAAVNKQVREHIAPAWDAQRVVVEYHAGDLASVQQEVPKGSWVFALLDNADQAGALGWHSVDDQDRIYGQIFAQPSLSDGKSTALTGPYAVSATFSHEAAETLGDRYCNDYADTGRGFLVAKELSDPVEADGYLIDGVQVSNFILPAWFDVYGKSTGPYDYLGRCTAPFSMTPGGYWVQMKSATETQQFKRTREWLDEVGFDVRGKGAELVFSPEMPEWRRAQKMASGRNAIRRHAVAA